MPISGQVVASKVLRVALYPWRVARGMWRMITTLYTVRGHIWDFAVREVGQRYRGSALGLLLAFAYPFLMLTIYAVVFSMLLRGRVLGSISKSEWVLYLFSALNFWWPITEVLGGAPNFIYARANLVKRVVFPVEIIAPSMTLASLFHGLIGFAVYLIFFAAIEHRLPWRACALPLVLIPMILLCCGLGWLFGAIGVFFRDLTRITTPLVTAWFFLTPIVYPETVIPKRYVGMLWLNPVAVFVRQVREVAFYNRWPNWIELFALTMICFFFAFATYRVHLRLRPGYADVL